MGPKSITQLVITTVGRLPSLLNAHLLNARCCLGTQTTYTTVYTELQFDLHGQIRGGHPNHTRGFVTTATQVIGYFQEQATKCCHEDRIIVGVVEGGKLERLRGGARPTVPTRICSAVLHIYPCCRMVSRVQTKPCCRTRRYCPQCVESHCENRGSSRRCMSLSLGRTAAPPKGGRGKQHHPKRGREGKHHYPRGGRKEAAPSNKGEEDKQHHPK